MAKIYTATGDRGTTGLMDGRRVSKDDARIAALGDVDELNAAIGVAMLYLSDSVVVEVLRQVQDDLFVVGAEIATPSDTRSEKGPRISSDNVDFLERAIERLDLDEVKEFIIPRGSKAVAFLHLARTVARRAERSVVRLSNSEPVNPQLLRYMNRLSSLLYAFGVYAHRKGGLPEEHPAYGRSE